MASREHLKIIKQGVEVWNAWREQKRNIRPNLDRAELNYTNLRYANFSKTDLNDADLTDTDLTEADFTEANLTRAYCVRTNFTLANLTRADFVQAHLGMANLSEANLTRAAFTQANLTGANLTGADLTGATVFGTVFGNTNLTDVRGLETCHHVAPSILDHSTLAKSGRLPLAFLRGCGLPDALIDYLPSLLNHPFEFYSCFISYASKDHAFAERLYADLQNKGVRCYYAPEHMKIGDRIRPRIDETIRLYDKLLLVLSKTSVENQWVEQEVETALARERQQGTTILFPVRIDNTVMTLETGWPALIRNTRNIGDFRCWKTHDVYQKAFGRLLRDLKATGTQP
jgi:hypothetical protein